MESYKLINPVVLGEIETEYKAKKAEEAAENAWKRLSSHISGNVPKMGITMKREKDNKLYHFVINEDRTDKKGVSYSIERIESKLTKKDENKLIEKANEMYKSYKKKMDGGKKRYDDSDDSDDSDSDSEFERKLRMLRKRQWTSPISYYWYNPLVYNSLSSVYIPTFVSPLMPYVEVDLYVSSALF